MWARHSSSWVITFPTWPVEWLLITPLLAYMDYWQTGSTDLADSYFELLYNNTQIHALNTTVGLIDTSKPGSQDELWCTPNHGCSTMNLTAGARPSFYCRSFSLRIFKFWNLSLRRRSAPHWLGSWSYHQRQALDVERDWPRPNSAPRYDRDDRSVDERTELLHRERSRNLGRAGSCSRPHSRC